MVKNDIYDMAGLYLVSAQVGPDRFGKCYRGGSNWIILALDNRELALVNVTGIRILEGE